MSSNDPQSDAAELRARAVALTGGEAVLSPENLAALSPETTRAMLHELQVHQIELELQNEELRRAQLELEDSRARYFDLYELAPVGYVTVSEPGLILEANLTACTLLGLARGEAAAATRSLVGQPFFRFLLREDHGAYHLFRQRLFETGEPQSCDVRMLKPDGTLFWVHLAAITAPDADGAPVGRMVLTDISERKQAEATLRESKKRLEDITFSLADWVWEVDEKGVYTYSSQQGSSFFGPSREDVIGKTPFDFMPPDEVKRVGAIFADITARKAPIKDLENWNITKNGERICLLTNGTPILDEAGNLKGYRGVDKDITAQRASENKLRLCGAALEAAANAIVITDRQGIIEWANSAFATLSGWSLTEAVGKNPRDLVRSGKHDAGFYRQMWDTLLAGKVWQGEIMNRRKDGALRTEEMTITPLCDERGEISHFIAIKQDITARQQAEEAWAATAERLALATRAGGVGIWDYDVVNNRLVWDDQMYRLYGITQSNFGGAYESWQAGLHPEDRQRAVETIQLALRGEKEFDSEFRVLWPDGTIRHLHAYAVVQRNVSGQPLRMIGTNWDITTHHRLEVLQKELEAKSQQFQKSESLGRMAGAIAHHFNNQLQVVRLNLELAASNRPETAEPDQGLSTAMQATRKAAEVSSQMLTYLGQSQVGQETLNLAEICRQSLALLKSTLPPSVVLETDLPSSGSGVRANANQIKQVLMNLITNAWESSGDGRGAIRLSVKTASAAEILAADHFPLDWQPQATAYACLEVADTGAGITAAKIPNIFDPFYSTKFIGRGLGLSVVLGIMRSHDGVVTVESEPSRGSVFRVFFPALAEAVPAKLVPVQLTPAPSKGGRRTVLVVEDEPALRKTLAFALEHFDFTVLEAGDGIEAMELFRQHRDEIGCVLCDVAMPRMDGWETLTALRQLAPQLPVILASGYDEAQVMRGDHPERPQAFLKKPFDLKVCINTVRLLTTSPA